MFNRKWLAGLAAALALAACSKPAAAPSAKPALWKVEAAGGATAYLFGTIHALSKPVDWRGPTLDAALRQSDRLILEVANVDDDTAMAQAFAALAQSPGLPPVSARLKPDLRDDLEQALGRYHIGRNTLDPYESWAAALILQQAASQASQSDTAIGVDKALLKGWTKPVEEFEGAAAQLGIFDRLPETAQVALLEASLSGQEETGAQLRKLEGAWARGDTALIASETEKDLSQDPVLHQALLVGRNRAWTAKLAALLKAGKRPFVAVGTAHLAGKDSIPAMLEAMGFKVTRIQ